MKRLEGSLRDLWDNIKHTNIRIIRVSEKKRKGKKERKKKERKKERKKKERKLQFNHKKQDFCQKVYFKYNVP